MSQVIAYAAFLHGLDVERLEQGPLRKPLVDAGYGSILDAVQAQDQEGAVDADSFSNSMQEFLDQGNFRLVLVLDEVSTELEKVVAYLDAITVQALTIDLMTLNRHWPPGDGRQRGCGYGRVCSVAASIWCSLFPGGFLFQNHYPRFRGAPSAFFKGCPQGRPSVDSGLANASW